jgi:hypothetical protein
VSFHQVSLRDIQSSLPDQLEFFGEDINASLNLGAGAFYYTENYYVAFQFQI